MAITSGDITEVIATEDDFGHEMRVGRVMRGQLGSKAARMSIRFPAKRGSLISVGPTDLATLD
jgi:hypothetical protein